MLNAAIDVGFGVFIGAMGASRQKSKLNTAAWTTGTSAIEQAFNPLFGVERSAKRFAFGAVTSTAAGLITHSLMNKSKTEALDEGMLRRRQAALDSMHSTLQTGVVMGRK